MTNSTVIAIHQPNYLPWLGYFHKIAISDSFIFLDNVQFSKNSYTNRVKVLATQGPQWLTVPVSFHLGDPINNVAPAVPDWPGRHLDLLRRCYEGAPAFRSVWARFQDLLHRAVSAPHVAGINRTLIEGLCREFGVRCRFEAASDLPVEGKVSDDRLIALVRSLDPKGTYLSGKGGGAYQDPEKFRAAGLGFRYVTFEHPVYDQARVPFEPGLSVVDPLFRLGWSGTAELIQKGAERA